MIKVCGKMFALVPLSEEPGSVNLKRPRAGARATRGVPRDPTRLPPEQAVLEHRGPRCSVEDDVVRDLDLGLLRPGRRGAAALDSRGADADSPWTVAVTQ